MNSYKTTRLFLIIAVTLVFVSRPVYAFAEGDELAWPREVQADNAKIIMYQPQIETFVGDKLTGRAAVSVTMKDSVNPVFGVVWIDSKVSVDKDARTVDILEITVTNVRFPNANEEHEKNLADLLEKDIPTWDLTLSLDRLLVSLELVEKESNASKDLKNDPPNIIYETTPSLLITIDGDPILQDLENTSLKSVLNTPFFLLYDTKGKNYYLKGGSIMWTADDLKGEWKTTTNPPKEVAELAKQYD